MTIQLQLLGDHALYGPAAAPGPGVLVLHGAEGPMAGWAHRFAVILAAQGFRALPFSYGEGSFFGAGPIREVDLGRTEAVLIDFADHPEVTRTGVFGWSKGAEHALLLAAGLGKANPLAALAVHAAPDHVLGAFDPADIGADGWPRLPAEPDAPRAWTWDKEDAPNLTPGAQIAIELYAGPVFLSHGLEDPVIPAAATRRLAERLTQEGRPPDVFLAESQGHGFSFDREPELWDRLTGFFARHLGAPVG
ncbi:MAG: prolyl oligopeptidase family serine peptidase [Pseudomonadota bacterium]